MRKLTEEELKQAEQNIRRSFEIKLTAFLEAAKEANYEGCRDISDWDFILEFFEWVTYE